MTRNETIETARHIIDQVEHGELPAPSPDELDALADRLAAFRLRALPDALRRQAVRLRTVGPRLPWPPAEAPAGAGEVTPSAQLVP